MAECVMPGIHGRHAFQEKIAHLREKRPLLRPEKGDPPDHGRDVLQESIKIPLRHIGHIELMEISMNLPDRVEQTHKVLLIQQNGQVPARSCLLEEQAVVRVDTNGSGHRENTARPLYRGENPAQLAIGLLGIRPAQEFSEYRRLIGRVSEEGKTLAGSIAHTYHSQSSEIRRPSSSMAPALSSLTV